MESILDIGGMLADHAREIPDKCALICEDRSITWSVLDRLANQVANRLQSESIGRGDRVGLLAELSVDSVVCFMGAVKAGACIVPLPARASTELIGRMIADADPKVLIAGTELHELGASPAHRISIGFAATGWLSLGQWLAGASDTAPGVEIDPDQPFNIIYSSGTTRAPKGIVQSHRMRAFQIVRMGRLGIDAATVMLLGTPLSSNTTLVALLPTLAHGGTACLMPDFSTSRYLELCRQHRVTHTMLVPVQYRRILDDPGFEGTDLSNFVLILCTGAPLRAATKRELLSRWPGRFVELYGQTEGGCTTVLDAGAHPGKLGSVGRPAEGVEVRILDDRGRPVPDGTVGEIAGRAMSMMLGYHRDEALTEALVWREDDGSVFYRTGDLGRLDEDGFLWLSGRTKDIIISGGVNIHVSDIAAVLDGHEAVLESAAIAVSSERWGETPLAVIVLKEEHTVSP